MRLLLFISIAALASPSFFKEKTVKIGHLLNVSCEGSGPDNSTARISALSNCRLLAADYLKQKVSVSNTSIQTESDQSLHSSVKTEVAVSNFSCRIKNEECQDKVDQAICYLRCEFDLSKVIEKSAKVNPKSSIETLGEPEDKNIEPNSAASIKSDRRSYSISTIPICTSILIEGKFSRVVRCGKNPVSVTLGPKDKTIIVRANGYQSKTIFVKDILNQSNEELQVVLSK